MEIITGNSESLAYLFFLLQKQKTGDPWRQTKADCHHEKIQSVSLLSCEIASDQLPSMNPLAIAIFLQLSLIEPAKYAIYEQ